MGQLNGYKIFFGRSVRKVMDLLALKKPFIEIQYYQILPIVDFISDMPFRSVSPLTHWSTSTNVFSRESIL